MALDETRAVELGHEARGRARDRLVTEGQRVGGRERGAVGRGFGPAREHDRTAHGDDRDGEHQCHRDEGAHQHGRRPPLLAPVACRAHGERSARMVTRAESHGSGMSGPTSGRSVTDR